MRNAWSRTLAAVSLASAALGAARGARADDVAECVSAAEEGQSLRSAHLLRAARMRLLACSQTTCPAVVRSDCAGWLAEVEKLLPTVVLEARDANGADLVDVQVFVDDQLLTDRLDGLSVAVDPGIHQFRFERPGVPAVLQQAVIREGEKGRTISVRLESPQPAQPAPLPVLPPPREHRRVSPLAYVFGGVALASLGSFAYFGLTGRAEAADLADGCGRNKTCRESQVAPVRTKLLVADVSLGVGLLSLGAGAYFLIWDRRSTTSAFSTSVGVSPGPGSVSVVGRF